MFNIFGFIWKGIKTVISFAVSDKAKQSIQTASALVEIALPIVTKIASLDPKITTLDKVEALYKEYAVPYINSYIEDPKSIGNALLNLATELLSRALPANSNASTSILQTAIQLALLVSKGNK